MKYDVFISYRREGGDTLAQLLYDRLTHQGYQVFLDIESLNAGKFNEKLLNVIEECKDMIIVLPPNALDRCKNEGDWVYRELKHAIECSKNIIPVIMKDFVWPEDMPEDIADIKNYNGILDNKVYFDAVIDRIISLLKSKPVIGINFRKKFQRKKNNFQNKIKMLKKIILAILLIALGCVGVTQYLEYKKGQEIIKSESYVTIKLTASEDMTASEFYDALEVVEKRIEILADGQEYLFEEEKDKASVYLPVEVFHDLDVGNILCSYVIFPMDIYLSAAELDEYFHIERNKIENVEIVTDVPEEVDLSYFEPQGLEEGEECKYFAVTVDKETAEEAKEWMKEKNQKVYNLYQDCELLEGKRYWYPLAGAFEDNNTLYFFDIFQYDNTLNLAQYNFENETFSGHLMYSCEMPVHWESEGDEGVTFGDNQCNVDKLSGQLARYDFETASDEFTQGEYQDTVRVFKQRLDSFGTPYAMGYSVSNPYEISVKIDPRYINNIVANDIGTRGTLCIKSNLYEILDYYNDIDNVEICQNKNGSYYLEITPSEYWFEYDKEDSVDVLEENEELYLCISDFPYAPLDMEVLSDCFDGEKFIFDGLWAAGLYGIEEEEKYIYEFYKTIQMNDPLPFEYEIKNIFLDDDLETEDIEYIIPCSTISEEVQNEYEIIISQIEEVEEYEVKVSGIGKKVEINMKLSEDSFFAENVNTIFQTLYEKCDMGSGRVQIIDIEIEDCSGKGYISLNLDVDTLEHKVSFYAYYSSGLEEKDINQFEKIINEDPFYDQVYISDYYMEDGWITFQD